MNLLIIGAHLANRGSELMLRSLVGELRRRHPCMRLAISPRTAGLGRVDDLELDRLAFPLPHVGDRWRFAAGFALRRLPVRPGRLAWEQVDLIFDIAGFAYSDQWGAHPAANLARLLADAGRHGARTVLLPQAFGPFDEPRTAAAMRQVIGRAERLFARDPESLAHLEALTRGGPGLAARLALGPDLTLAYAAVERDEGETGYLIPNVRMLDQGAGAWGDGYTELLAELVRRGHRPKGQRVALAVHDAKGGDLRLAREVQRAVPEHPVELVVEEDPRRLKARLAGARWVVGSRFHALASALSCAVPALALGWSHKYRHLCRDYGVEELAFDRPRPEIVGRFDRLADPGHRAELRQRLRDAQRRIVERAEAMWLTIEESIAAADAARTGDGGSGGASSR